jgi:hypothetical protein
MRGVIFSATGDRYVAAAVSAAERSARLNPVPHTLFCSNSCYASGIQIIPFETSGNPHIDKILSILASPYDETIYLDVDCLAVGRFTELFDLLKCYDLAAAHAPGYRGALDPDVPTSFYEINTGVLVYRRTARVLDLMREWRDTYSTWLAQPPFEGADGRILGQDQPAFRRCLWRSRIAIYILAPEYNWRFLVPSFLCREVKIIHGFVANVDRLAARINKPPLCARVYPALSKGYGIDSQVEADQILAELDSVR